MEGLKKPVFPLHNTPFHKVGTPGLQKNKIILLITVLLIRYLFEFVIYIYVLSSTVITSPIVYWSISLFLSSKLTTVCTCSGLH